MRIVYFQGVGGASGDMILGALAALGADMDAVRAAVASLAAGPIRIRCEPFASHGLNGLRATVEADGHHHGAGGHGHGHRGLAEIRAMIAGGALSERAREWALAAFQRLGEAEAAVHQVPLESVHFHEVGALDSIADIVGGCVALDRLGADAVCVAPLPVGSGTVECAHGVYPTPAPATCRLLEGMPIVVTPEPVELVTPTGAALLATWRSLERPPPGARMLRSGYGFGQRTLQSRPNALRATLLESPAADLPGAECLVLECEVDDTIPELVGALVPRLLEAGALDAYVTPVQMKKQRPGVLLTVLAEVEQREALLDLVFRGCTTFGVREHLVTRTMLDRRIERVTTPFGDIRVKIGSWRGEDITRAPEMDDCLAAAAAAAVSVRAVYDAVLRTDPRQPSLWRSTEK